MIAALVLVLLIPLFLVHCYKNAYKKPPNFPPGPPSLPVYGAFWIVLAMDINNLSKAFQKLGAIYRTKAVGLYLGSVPTVVLNDPSDIKEMLNREEFDGRMDIILFRLRSYWKKLGIFFTDGYFWHVQRRFTLRYLRDFGFGRRDATLEAVMAQEIREMIDMRVNGPKYPAEEAIVKGELVYLPYYFAVPFINGIVHVLSRMTVPREDYEVLWELAKGTLLFQRSSNDIGGALSLTPWLKDILPNYSGYNSLKKGNQYLLNFFRKLVEEVISTHDERHSRHFLDMYITKMKEEQRTKKKTTYSVDQLVLTCTDYMFPSASAVQMTLSLLVERMLLQPDIQDRIHEEIDRVVGVHRPPTLDDRKDMPYTEACLREIMRHETLVPLGVPHRAMRHTTIAGYHVAEGTMLSPNLTMIHTDEGIWGDPENFRPERFIEDGKLCLAKDKSLPFGAGRRLCAGETYARQSMFQVFASFMQSFTVSSHDGKPVTRPAPRIQGIITSIPEFWVKITPRS